MTEESVVSEEMKKMVGVEAEPEVYEVEKGHIRRFAEAVGDPNPLWRDETYARKSRYGNIVAPPTFLQDRASLNLAEKLLKMAPPTLKGILNGGTEVECYKPMVVGDVLTTRARVVDIYEKQGRSGKLLFMAFEAAFTNQRGELVAKGRLTLIKR